MKTRLMLAGMASVLLLAGTLHAGVIIIEDEPFDSGIAGFSVANEVGSSGAGVANGGGYLNVTTPPTHGAPPDTDRITTTTGAFIGDYTGQQVQFDFLYDNDPLEVPIATGALYLFFSDDGGNEWIYTVDLSSASDGSYGTYAVDMNGGTGWNQLLGSDSFADSVDNVQSIGFRLTYLTDTVNPSYQFDNLRRQEVFSVPEPETYAAIAFALLSLCITFRKQLNEKIGMAREQLRA